jgi:hypothetical protein
LTAPNNQPSLDSSSYSSPGEQTNRQVADSNLGTRLAVFRGRPIGLITWLLLFIPGGLVIIFSYLYGTFLARNAYLEHGPALALIRAQYWFTGATILLILLITYFIYRLLTSLQRFEVCDRGILQRTRLLRKVIYRWGEFAGISSSATAITLWDKHIRTVPRGNLYLKNGKSINLTNRYQNIPHLVKIVKSKIYPLIWPILKSDFRSGRLVHFGRISLDNRDILISRSKIPWPSVYRIGVTAGFLVIELRDDSSHRVPISSLPNPELLLKIVDWGISP